MKSILAIFIAASAGCAAFSYEPAGEQEFARIASGGCDNRDGDFFIRGMLSTADDETVVLSDPSNPRTTMVLPLPGRGMLVHPDGTSGRGKHAASVARMNELRETQTPVVVTLRCRSDGTPIARSIDYPSANGSRASILY
jgi:hypothetical protein